MTVETPTKNYNDALAIATPPPGPLSFRVPSSMAATAACLAPVQSTRLTEPHRYHSHNAPPELPPPMYNKRLRGRAHRNLARVFFISIACDVRQYDSRQCHDCDDGDVLEGAVLSFPLVYSPSGSVATTCFAKPRGRSARVLQRLPTRELVDVTTRSRLP